MKLLSTLLSLSIGKLFLFILLMVALLTAVTSQTTPTIEAAEMADFLPTPNNPCSGIYLPSIIGDSEAEIAFFGQGIAPPPLSPSYESCAGFPDFNGDGYADLAIGVPDEDVGATEAAGAVNVIYGTANGLVALDANALTDDQIWHRGITGLNEPIAIDSYDRFGEALAYGDFNNDGYDDLAIGVPGSLINGQEGVGAVQVLYGSANGLALKGTQTWSQDLAGITGAPEMNDRFGETLAAGDFNGDGIDDLAIGVPHESVFSGGVEVDHAGAVNIIYGADGGLSSIFDDILTQGSVAFFATLEQDDHFGDTLTSGDFNGDSIDDLAVGIRLENVGALTTGAVQIFFGGIASGILDPADAVDGVPIYPQEITANTTGVDNALEAGDQFGFSLAAGDFNGDGYDDLAIGSPYEDVGALYSAGAVNILFGANGGPLTNPTTTAVPAPIWHQNSSGIDGTAASAEYFGWSLEAADFNNDGYVDLAIGIRRELDPFAGILNIGAVQILYSDNTGPTADGNQLLYDPDNPADEDQFGVALTAVDANGDSYIDLIVGAPDDDPVGLGINNVGSVFVFHSDSNGVSQSDSQTWYQGNNGVIGAPEADDRFGNSLP
ncbi:putative integrin-like protein [hydrothermal vent metagenome]|uniref:Putative integrin-like protein n=1 Tax=hydrothermal vent metagenome TaxID=652676 RepID=A0A3B0UQQ1_9ZZZZ